nr:thiamine pyrophosphate-binding protein [Herbidospora cretacea]
MCAATSGPGGIHLLNGLHDAKLDHAPVLAIHRDAGDVRAGHGLPAGGQSRPVI